MTAQERWQECGRAVTRLYQAIDADGLNCGWLLISAGNRFYAAGCNGLALECHELSEHAAAPVSEIKRLIDCAAVECGKLERKAING